MLINAPHGVQKGRNAMIITNLESKHIANGMIRYGVVTNQTVDGTFLEVKMPPKAGSVYVIMPLNVPVRTFCPGGRVIRLNNGDEVTPIRYRLEATSPTWSLDEVRARFE